jgi:Domain of unknown function (DUF4351)
MTGTFPQPDRLGRDWDFPFHLVRVWEVPAERLLRGPLAMLPLTPLTRVDPDEVPRVLSEMNRRTDHEATRAQAETLWAATFQLLALRYDQTTIERWRDFMATLDISKTPLVKMIQRDAAVEQARASLLRQGQKKFGTPAPGEIQATISGLADLDRLNALSERLLDVNSWQELLAR